MTVSVIKSADLSGSERMISDYVFRVQITCITCSEFSLFNYYLFAIINVVNVSQFEKILREQ